MDRSNGLRRIGVGRSGHASLSTTRPAFVLQMPETAISTLGNGVSS